VTATHATDPALEGRFTVAEGVADHVEVTCAAEIAMKKILVPTDFSDCARRAEETADGLSRFFLGSVADRIVRLALCPVMTVRADGGDVGRRPGASAD
jgi:hypothetical protein